MKTRFCILYRCNYQATARSILKCILMPEPNEKSLAVQSVSAALYRCNVVMRKEIEDQALNRNHMLLIGTLRRIFCEKYFSYPRD